MADQPKEARGITAIAVSGFKSLRDESRIEIRNLTVLAGANSSGKSSIMQPLLLLKQTFESGYDPGALKIDAPNVRFTSSDQFLLRLSPRKYRDLAIYIEGQDGDSVRCRFNKTKQSGEIDILEMSFKQWGKLTTLRPSMTHKQIIKELPEFDSVRLQLESSKNWKGENFQWQVTRNRSFLGFELHSTNGEKHTSTVFTNNFFGGYFEGLIREVIHVPGLRGNPERVYPTTPVVGPEFPGLFQNYAAAVVQYWMNANNFRMVSLEQVLYDLRLTSGIRARRIDETRVELHVARTLNNANKDFVSIADVGFGVSQVLPVLVALLVAEPGQLVYIEQPELHLHPRAQVKLAEIIADAANRGVRIVIETHSDLLILGIQTLVAEGKLATDKVILHWFTRSDEGITKITPTTLDETGAFQDAEWPEDFGEVRLDIQSRFLDAADIAELKPENADQEL